MTENQIKKEFIEPFIEGTKKTLQVQCGIDVTPKDLFIRDPKIVIHADLISILGLADKTIDGSLSLCFKKTVFLNIMRGMFKEPELELSPEIYDGANEILNMIFGNAKTVLNNKGYALKKSLPSLVTGENIMLLKNENASSTIIFFQSDVGDFFLEVSVLGKK